MLDWKELQQITQNAILSQIGEKANTISLNDLIAFSETEKGAFLRGMTLEEIARFESCIAEAVNTRTKVWRKQYRDVVLSVLGEAPEGMTFAQILKKAGGTEVQLRTAIGSLKKNSIIDQTKRTKGAKYILLEKRVE